MSLILAIEPDRRQASQLTAVIRGRLRADLVLADSAERALAALGDRVPDLILTSALLSSKDESMLGDRLRTLDAAAAHVQTLTIPVLGAPERRSSGRGSVLSALLGDRGQPGAAPEACDPAVFAEQCAAYLERAAAERERQADAADLDVVNSAPACEETAIEAEPGPPPTSADDRANEAVEIDLSSLLDEAIVRQLSAAIETVTAARSSGFSRDSGFGVRDAKPVQASAIARTETWTPVPVGNAVPWPRIDGLDAESGPPQSRPLRPRPQPHRGPQRKPLQDEWGFFDPEQCGFAALLAKLDEITHVASPLPAENPSAGSPDVSR